MWDNIQVGQKLLVKGAVYRIGRRVVFTEWKEYTVEKVTKGFYFVEGNKYRKDQEGKNFLHNFSFPGSDGVPDRATSESERENIVQQIKLINEVSFIGHSGVESISDINKAVELSVRLKAVLDEIKKALKE